MLDERGTQSDAEPVLRETEALTAVSETEVPERAAAVSPSKPLTVPRSERAITGVYRDPVTWAIALAVFGA